MRVEKVQASPPVSVDLPGRDDPGGRLSGGLSQQIEVRVVVQQNQAEYLGGRGDE